MTQQELIEQNVRATIGDLTLQLIVARAANQVLQEEIERLRAEAKPRPNGKVREHAEDHPSQPG